MRWEIMAVVLCIGCGPLLTTSAPLYPRLPDAIPLPQITFINPEYPEAVLCVDQPNAEALAQRDVLQKERILLLEHLLQLCR